MVSFSSRSAISAYSSMIVSNASRASSIDRSLSGSSGISSSMSEAMVSRRTSVSSRSAATSSRPGNAGCPTGNAGCPSGRGRLISARSWRIRCWSAVSVVGVASPGRSGVVGVITPSGAPAGSVAAPAAGVAGSVTSCGVGSAGTAGVPGAAVGTVSSGSSNLAAAGLIFARTRFLTSPPVAAPPGTSSAAVGRSSGLAGGAGRSARSGRSNFKPNRAALI